MRVYEAVETCEANECRQDKSIKGREKGFRARGIVRVAFAICCSNTNEIRASPFTVICKFWVLAIHKFAVFVKVNPVDLHLPVGCRIDHIQPELLDIALPLGVVGDPDHVDAKTGVIGHN